MKTLLTILLLALGYPSFCCAQQYVRVCENGVCRMVRVVAQPAYVSTAAFVADESGLPPVADATPAPYVRTVSYVAERDPLATGEAAHTPTSEVVRVLDLLPKPEIAFVDFGCGYDARWCVAAAEKWGCKCIGIEIDPQRAAAARERVRNLGLDRLITILEGDAGTVPVSGDVAVVYLYPDTLARMKPRLEGFKAFASYLHQPAGMNCTKNGDTWFYRRPVVQQVAATQGAAVWNGALYSQPVCNSPNCAMCNSIRRQIGR